MKCSNDSLPKRISTSIYAFHVISQVIENLDAGLLSNGPTTQTKKFLLIVSMDSKKLVLFGISMQNGMRCSNVSLTIRTNVSPLMSLGITKQIQKLQNGQQINGPSTQTKKFLRILSIDLNKSVLFVIYQMQNGITCSNFSLTVMTNASPLTSLQATTQIQNFQIRYKLNVSSTGKKSSPQIG